MDAKKNLNNTQRKMLDEIYTKSIENKISDYTTSRDVELSKLKQAELDKVAKNKDVKAFLDTMEKARNLFDAANDVVRSVGLEFNVSKGNDHAKVQHDTSWRAETPEYIKAFNRETQEKVSEIRRIKDEVRLRVYGSDATYASIEAEINELLKGVL